MIDLLQFFYKNIMEYEKMKRSLIVLLLLALTVSSHAQLDRSKRPAAGPAPEVKIGDAQSFELTNGLKVFVVENHKLPRVTFNLSLDLDPILEGKNAGYTDAAGQLLRTGTKKRTKDKMDQEIDLLGASLSTSASGISASGLEKNKEKIFEIMSDIVLNSDFKQEELDKIKKQKLSELATTKDEPNAISQRIQSILVYGKDHPYGEPETEETVGSISLDMCKGFYQTYFRPNVAYLAIVGDITLVKAKTMVEKYLNSWEKKDVPKNTFATPKAPVVTKVTMVDRSNSVQSVVTVCYPVDLPIGGEDAIRANVLNTILGGSATGRLFMNLREKHGYTYGSYSNISPDKLVGSFMATASVRNAVTDSALTEIMSEMKKIRNEKVSAEDLEKTKNLLAGNFIRSLEQPSTIARFAINIARYNLPKDYYKNYIKNLSTVTVDEILAVAKKYIKPSNANILVVGKADEVAKNLSKFSITGKLDYLDLYGEKYDPNVKKAPEGLTAEQVVSKYVDALGGREKLEKVQDETLKMTGAMQGMTINITIIRKAPNKLYQLVDFGVGQAKTIFNGTKGTINQMGQEQEISGAQLEAMKYEAAFNAYLDYTKLGAKLELSGMETINNKDTYKVTIIYPSGKKSVQNYDVQSGFLVRQSGTVESAQGAANVTTEFADYKETKGFMIPQKIIQGTPMGSIELTMTSYENNTNPSDDNFKVN
jgi:zinc protease